MTRRILVIGSGGREHALAWRLARDPDPPEVLVAPGNPGMGDEVRRLSVGELDAAALVAVCRSEAIDLVVIGPEAPLAAGVADALVAAGLAVFGPSRAAARIESSKWFAKRLMLEAGVPTARAVAVENAAEGRAALERFAPPWVLKADGLAAGKGVRIAGERAAAEEFLADCLERGRFGEAGSRVVLEEHVAGPEVSAMAVCDGRDFVLLPAARDFKRAHDGDRGPNTGGMGAVAPVPGLEAGFDEEVGRRVVAPVLAALERRGTPFRGTLYAGLALAAGGLRVLEFNARFGDPETEAVLPLLGGSLSRLLASAARGRLEGDAVTRRPGAAVAVALVDAGYPERLEGGEIRGLEALGSDDELMVFTAGVRRTPRGLALAGGRAAYVVARAASPEAARERAYQALSRLGGEGFRWRSDVAAPAVSSDAEPAGHGMRRG